MIVFNLAKKSFLRQVAAAWASLQLSNQKAGGIPHGTQCHASAAFPHADDWWGRGISCPSKLTFAPQTSPCSAVCSCHGGYGALLESHCQETQRFGEKPCKEESFDALKIDHGDIQARLQYKQQCHAMPFAILSLHCPPLLCKPQRSLVSHTKIEECSSRMTNTLGTIHLEWTIWGSSGGSSHRSQPVRLLCCCIPSQRLLDRFWTPCARPRQGACR